MRRVAPVTGASSGIGAAAARLLARRGWDLALHYGSNRAGAEAVSADCAAAGAKTAPLQADFADPAADVALFDAFDAAFPRLDARVANAGMVDRPARIADMAPDRLVRTFTVNTISALRCAGAAGRRMSLAEGGAGGAIILASPVAARLGAGALYADYPTAQAGLDTLARGLSDELAPEGVRVVSLRPGVIDTAIHAKGGLADRAAAMAPPVPMRRAGTAEEVAEAIRWLIEEATYVSGTTLDIAGRR